ncbi:hypothetical protein GIB67_039873, partial [Kingdonia uniflora]
LYFFLQAWYLYCRRDFRSIDKQLPSLTTLDLQYVSTQLSNCLHRANDYYFRCKWILL